MGSEGFIKFARFTAVLAAISGLCYSFSFVFLTKADSDIGLALSSLFLLLGGLLATPIFVALYLRFRAASEGFATLALLLAMIAAIGGAVHGAYDLANTINPPQTNPTSLANLPSAIDPRGFLAFGLPAFSTLIFAALIRGTRQFPSWLSTIGYSLAFLLIWIYLSRLIVLTPTNPFIMLPAALTGFVVSPLWYLGLAQSIGKNRQS